MPCKVLVWAGIAQSMWRLGYGPNDLEFEFRQGHKFFSSPKRGSGGEWSASRPGCFTPWRNKARFPLIMSLVVPQSRSGRFGEERNVLFVPGTESRFPAPSVVLSALYTFS